MADTSASCARSGTRYIAVALSVSYLHVFGPHYQNESCCTAPLPLPRRREGHRLRFHPRASWSPGVILVLLVCWISVVLPRNADDVASAAKRSPAGLRLQGGGAVLPKQGLAGPR